MIRHGDVNLHRVAEARGIEVKHDGSFVLARGEATGSVHTLEVEKSDDLVVRQDANGDLYFVVKAEGKVTHTSDHDTLTIEPGIYRQVPEREVDHFADSVVRKVVD